MHENRLCIHVHVMKKKNHFLKCFEFGTMKSNKQTKVLLMHENIDSAYMYGTSNEKKIIFINVLSLVLWNQTMSADAFDGENGSWTRNWSLFPLLAIHTHWGTSILVSWYIRGGIKLCSDPQKGHSSFWSFMIYE